jgi:hypothetical protein
MHISNANLDNAMIGNHVYFDGDFTSISIGDYSVLEYIFWVVRYFNWSAQIIRNSFTSCCV